MTVKRRFDNYLPALQNELVLTSQVDSASGVDILVFSSLLVGPASPAATGDRLPDISFCGNFGSPIGDQ